MIGYPITSDEKRLRDWNRVKWFANQGFRVKVSYSDYATLFCVYSKRGGIICHHSIESNIRFDYIEKL